MHKDSSSTDSPSITPRSTPDQLQESLKTAAECASALKAPKPTIYKMVREGMPAYKMGPRGRGLRFYMPEVLAWLRK